MLKLFFCLLLCNFIGHSQISDQEYVNKGLRLLGIGDVKITVVTFNRNLYNGSTKIMASVDGMDGSYTIFLHDNLKGKLRQRVIAHELIHIKEKESKELEIRGKQALYKGLYLTNWQVMAYEDRPWEEYALNHDTKLMGEINRALASN